MASNLSQANEFIADLNNMQPDYINFCIKSVQSLVQTKINEMKIVAAKCRNCTQCTLQGYVDPTISFVNKTCSIPRGAGDFLTAQLINASSVLADLESAWQIYRDDVFQKIDYLNTKYLKSKAKVFQAFDILTLYQATDDNSFETGPINSILFNSPHPFAYENMLMDFSKTIRSFNTYFMNQTDFFVIISNQTFKKTFSGIKDTQGRDKILNDFYSTLNQFSHDWNFYMSSSLYVGNVDAELSAVYSALLKIFLDLENCANGKLELSTECMKQVKKKLGSSRCRSIFMQKKTLSESQKFYGGRYRCKISFC